MHSFLGIPFCLICSTSINHCYNTGSKDGRVHMWAADSGQKVAVLDGNHPGPTHCVKFNPKFMTMTTACTNVVSESFKHVHFTSMEGLTLLLSFIIVSTGNKIGMYNNILT